MYRASRMSQTETKVVTPRQRKETIQIGELRTVKWIQNVGVVKRTYDVTSKKYISAKCWSGLLAWIFGTIEMVIISIYLFIHSLPWPDWVMQIILKIDQLIENILDAVSDKLEWWWDNLMVRLMWFRDMIESLIDAFLSLCLFVVYKSIELWMWTISVTISILKFIFAPLIWIVTTIFPPPPPPSQKESNPSLVSTPPMISAVPDSKAGTKQPEPEPEEVGHFSGTTSDCESDVSVVSESWSLRHTDKTGKGYNRVEMKATAEGRLRAAMYKRVKAQLSLMRKNSVNFSRGMTSYARQYLEPKVIPVISVLRTWLRDMAAKYGMLDTYDRITAWIGRHYFLSSFATIAVSLAIVPFNIINKILLGRKKKSRRTRSMRSESLRRRTAAASSSVVTPPGLEPMGLIKSEEPVVMEEPEFCRYDKLPRKGSEDESSRDSALASSLDDLCHTSDSNDGSNSLKDQTIHEEEYKQEEDDETPTMKMSQQLPPLKIESLNDKVPSNVPKSPVEKSETEVKQRRTGGSIVSKAKRVPGSSNASPAEAKTKAGRKEVEPSSQVATQDNSKQKIVSKTDRQHYSSQSRTPHTIMKETYAEVTKLEEKEERPTEDEKITGPRTRKISFSLDN